MFNLGFQSTLSWTHPTKLKNMWTLRHAAGAPWKKAKNLRRHSTLPQCLFDQAAQSHSAAAKVVSSLKNKITRTHSELQLTS